MHLVADGGSYAGISDASRAGELSDQQAACHGAAVLP